MTQKQNPYASFKTNPKAEKQGVWVDYGPFGVLLARAGGSNEAYLKAAERKGRLLRRTGRNDMVALRDMNRDLVIETCVLGWAVNEPNEAGQLMKNTGVIYDAAADENVEANRANIRRILSALPELVDQLAQDAQDASLFNQVSDAEQSEEVGN